MFEMYIEATVRGYHAYLDNASVRIVEIFACEMELDNSHDKYAVAVKNQDGNLVGHVPKELSRLFHKIHIWESSTGNYLRRTLLMTSTSVKFSESQKTQQDKKTLIVHISIYQPQAKQILICCI